MIIMIFLSGIFLQALLSIVPSVWGQAVAGAGLHPSHDNDCCLCGAAAARNREMVPSTATEAARDMDTGAGYE